MVVTPATQRRIAGAIGLALGLGLLGIWGATVIAHAPAYVWGALSLQSMATLALATLLTVVGARLLRGGDTTVRSAARARPAAATTPAPPTQAPVPVPPESMEEAEAPVAACLKCGSTRVEPVTLGDGLFPGGEALEWVCRRCHHRGQPLQFDNPTGYRQFVKGLHENR